MKNYMSKTLFKTVVVALMVGSTSAFAQEAGPANTISSLWSQISFADTIAAIFGIGALVIGVDLAQLGYMKVRRLVKGAH